MKVDVFDTLSSAQMTRREREKHMAVGGTDRDDRWGLKCQDMNPAVEPLRLDTPMMPPRRHYRDALRKSAQRQCVS